MGVLMAIVLGLIQGLTEFLPVSSSGHLVLAQTLFSSVSNVEADFMLFDVLLHLGTLISVVIAFWKDIKELFFEFFRWIRDGFKIKGQPYRRFLLMVILAVVPMFLVVPFKSKLEEAFSSPLVVGIMLLVTAVLLLLSEKAPKKHKDEKTATWLDALLVGVAQCFAVVPGLSRSGTTICTGLFRGFSREFAVKFAFILSIPVVLGANILELGEAIATPPVADVAIHVYIIGILVAMLSGLAAIKLVRYVSKSGNYRPFAVYCTIIGIVTIVASFFR